MWRLKYFWNVLVVLFQILRQREDRLWLRYRENGNNKRWRLDGRRFDILYRKEKTGTPMTKAQAQQWEMIQAFQSSDEELSNSLILCTVSLVTWIALLRMNDEIETAEDRETPSSVEEE